MYFMGKQNRYLELGRSECDHFADLSPHTFGRTHQEQCATHSFVFFPDSLTEDVLDLLRFIVYLDVALLLEPTISFVTGDVERCR